MPGSATFLAKLRLPALGAVGGLLLLGMACQKTSNTNVNVAADTNTSISANVNINSSTNVNLSTNSNANISTTNTNTSNVTTYTVATAIAHASAYNNQRLCLRGYYQNSFEFVALAGNRTPGSYDLVAPYVWLGVADATIAKIATTCQGGDGTNPKTCYSPDLVTVCGVFHYSASGGLGHTGAYSYTLTD